MERSMPSFMVAKDYGMLCMNSSHLFELRRKYLLKKPITGSNGHNRFASFFLHQVALTFVIKDFVEYVVKKEGFFFGKVEFLGDG